jgi:predicted permease
MFSDLRLAFRHLAKSPGFTATALLTLALCLGANLTIFTVVDAILVRPLPFPEAKRLVAVVNSYPGGGYPRGGSSIPNYFDRRHAIPAFASVSLISQSDVVVGDPGSPQRVPIANVTPEFFITLGVPLALGRRFTEDELTYATGQVAILTDEFWRMHFQRDSQVLGKTFLNDGSPVTVVGVLPPGFRYLSSKAQFFRPFAHDPSRRSAQNRHFNQGDMVARLTPIATLAEAQAQIDALNAAQASDDPKRSFLQGWGYRSFVRSLHEDQVSAIKPTLVLLQTGAFTLLLIGLVNLANLLLIRASNRTKELAIRQALGASGQHIAGQVLAETMLLALGGGAAGLLLGAFGSEAVARWGASQLPLGVTIAVDPRIALCGLVATLAIGALLSLPVIWFSLHAKLAPSLQLESRGGTASRSAQRLRHGFIVVQVSFAFVLLSGAGLLGSSLKRVLETPAGFQAERVLTGKISLPYGRYPRPAVQTFVDRLLPAIRALPGVTSVAINNSMPFTGLVAGAPVSIEGRAAQAGEAVRAHHRSGVTSDYFASMGIPLVRGRLLEAADDQRTPAACLIDQAMAERYWPGADPVGRRLAFNPTFTEKDSVTIVGVVGNVKQNELGEADGFGMTYFPFPQFPTNFFYLVVRSSLPFEAMAPSIRQAILQLDPELPVDDLRPLQTRIDDSLLARRSPALLAGIFAGVALLLVSVGLYGVMAYAVAQRTREFGIRLALGAQHGALLRMVFRQGARLALLGLAAGIALALPASSYVSSQLFGVNARDPATFAVVAILLSAVSSLACFLPARRATKVDPMTALRAE